MRWYHTAFIWALVITIGAVGSRFYKEWIASTRPANSKIVHDHEAAWDKAIGDPKKSDRVSGEPPNTNALLQEEPPGNRPKLGKNLAAVDEKKLPLYYEKIWQAALRSVGTNPRPDKDALVANEPAEFQSDFRKSLDKIDEKHLEEYNRKVDELAGEVERSYREEWQKAAADYDDTPDPKKFAAEHMNKRLLEEKPALVKKLEDASEQLKRKMPRVKIALDSFSGYCVFRTPEFRKNLEKKSGTLVLHLVDDGANYNTRIKTLESGETPLAVFTIDALVNNSALCDSPPGSIVLLLDETQGADAIIGYKETFPDLASMNRADLKIIGVRDSPSETLARVVRTKLELTKVPGSSFVPADGPDDVVKQFKDASPKDPKVFVLWEPYISQVLKDYPDAHRIADSSRFNGYIVDVLVAQKDYLKKHPDEVQAVVEAYLESLPSQRTMRGMTKLVLEDSRRLVAKKKQVPLLTEEDAEKVVQGIWWKTARENYAHFGLVPGTPLGVPETVDDMIKNISSVLIQTKALTKMMPAEQFVDKDISTKLQQMDFVPRDRTWARTAGDQWLKLRPVHKVGFEKIPFGRRSDVPDDDDVKAILQKAIDLMKANPNYYLEIQGHHAKSSAADDELALTRARSVQRYLQEQGNIPAERMRALALDAIDSAGTEDNPEKIVTLALFQSP
jgi:hypothetical protein